MSAPDAFALGGPADLSDEIIVDEDELRALALLADEPVLGPLARELFEADELFGNTRGGDPHFDDRARRSRELDRKVIACPAQTIGGIAWRLRDLNQILKDADGISNWAKATLRAALDDAVRLATLGSPQDQQPSAKTRAAAAELADAILRAIPDYDPSLSFLEK